jgi:diguanylate cyclase (GGDEF)-like protein
MFFIPAIIVLILIIINIFEPFIYTIDEYGEYSRLVGFTYVSGLSYILVFYSVFIQVYSLFKKFRFEITILLISNIIAFFGSFSQFLSSSSLSFYPFITIGFVIIYVFFESIENRKDELTNLFDRRKIYEIIDSKIIANKPFSLVMLDLDNLKILNDNFGHHIGDYTIVDFSNKLKSKFQKDAILGRVGGDEFVLISCITEEEIVENLGKIDSSFYDASNKYEYEFSYGISHSKDYSNVNTDLLLQQSDKKMYAMKAIHKNYRRRASDVTSNR